MKRVICVEDDVSLRNVFSLIFDRAGYETIICPDGTSILNNDFPVPDIFILDKNLSGVNGLNLCRFLKSQERTQHIPVIMISASLSLATEAGQAGADNYLEKPFKLKDLLDMTENYLVPNYVEI